MFHKLRSKRWRSVGVCAVGCLLLALAPASGADDSNSFVIDDLTFDGNTITFDTTWEGLPWAAPKLFEEADPLRNEYEQLGVHFGGAQGSGGGAVLNKDSNFGVNFNARSGANFLAFNREAAAKDGTAPREPLVIAFDFPVKSVFLYAAGGFVPETFRIDAYNRAGTLVDTNTAAGQDYQKLAVADAAGITRVLVSRVTPAPHVAVTIPEVTGSPGGQVDIPVQVDNRALALGAIQFALKHSDVIAVTDPAQITAGPLLKDGILQSNLATAGTVEVSGATGQGANGPGAVVTIKATIRADAPQGKYPLHLDSAQLADVFGQPFQADMVDGSLTVGPAVACGDLDGAGGPKVTDAVIALRISVNLQTPTASQTQAACGHPINVAFAVLILRAAVGLSGPIPPAGG